MTMQTDIGAAYDVVQDAIKTALKKTTDSDEVNTLLAEYNAARNAYTKAQNAQLNDTDPLLQSLADQLEGASKALEAASDDIQNWQGYMGTISAAVGALSKIAALVG